MTAWRRRWVTKLLQTSSLSAEPSGRNGRLSQASRPQGPAPRIKEAHRCPTNRPPLVNARLARSWFVFFFFQHQNLGTGWTSPPPPPGA